MLLEEKHTLPVNLVLVEGVSVVCESLKPEELRHLLCVPLARLTRVRAQFGSMTSVLPMTGALGPSWKKVWSICEGEMSCVEYEYINFVCDVQTCMIVCFGCVQTWLARSISSEDWPYIGASSGVSSIGRSLRAVTVSQKWQLYLWENTCWESLVIPYSGKFLHGSSMYTCMVHVRGERKN